MSHTVKSKEEVLKLSAKHWEKTANSGLFKNGINPQAYDIGFVDSYFYFANESLSTQSEGWIAAELKEIGKYLDDLVNNHLQKDAGHLWIAFSDKFNAFKKKLLPESPQAPVTEIDKVN